MTLRSPFRCLKTSPEVMRLAVMLYVRFPFSLWNVEDLLHERGIEVSHETVRAWWRRFGPMFAAEIRRKRAQPLGSVSRWHLDEVFVRINGQQHYFSQAFDPDGGVLEAFVTKRRDKPASFEFLCRLMKRHVRPAEVVTDKLRSYGAAVKEPKGEADASRHPGRATGPRARTSRSDDARGSCGTVRDLVRGS